MITVYVGKNREYTTINDALNSLPDNPEEAVVFIDGGIYEERVNLKRNNVTLLGDANYETRITASEYAYRVYEDGEKVGTFRTATFMADCDNFVAKNIIFENSAGQGSVVGQAIALYADGINQRYYDCTMLGYQDTVFTAPLPPKEFQKNGFLGEKQFAERRDSLLYFERCRIEGNIDYIFGGAEAYFRECVLFTRKRDTEGICYVTAASTPEHREIGYVFDSCKFMTDAPKGTVYLGRPWREFAKTFIKNSYLDEGIHPDGFHDWNKVDAHSTIEYQESNNYGPGASLNRADFVSVE